LATEEGSYSMFVNPNSIESVFLLMAEDEGKEKLKE
jgi:hypothetical protein